MNLKPFYHLQNPQWRVVYRPHSRWFVQRLSDHKASREHDPWEDIGRPKDDKEQAMKSMYRMLPLVLRA
jgi:hypothetical protein